MIKKTFSNQSCGRDRECKMVRFKSPSVYVTLYLILHTQEGHVARKVVFCCILTYIRSLEVHIAELAI